MNKRRSLRSLDWLAFLMADAETGVGPFISTYLSAVRHWNPAQVGIVVATQSIASVAAQIPEGWLVDWFRPKKALVAMAAVVIASGCLGIVHAPSVPLAMLNQAAIGMATAIVSPAIAAISLGLVGKACLDRRVGRNSTFSHSGNALTALCAGFVGSVAGQQSIFYACASFGLAAAGAALLIRNSDVDDAAARAASENHSQARGFRELAGDRRILLFATLVVIFHLANAAMLPLAGQELARRTGQTSAAYMSACIVTSQMVMAPTAWMAGRAAGRFGRKPIFLFAFAVLALRGICFAAARTGPQIVATEALDGLGTGISGVVTILIVADLASGTGRFNLLQGAVQAGVGCGAFFSHSVAGYTARTYGFAQTFLGLSVVALTGLLIYLVTMPETGHAVHGRSTG